MNLDGKLRPTIRAPLRTYIQDLLATGLYGASESEVVDTLISEGVRAAIASRLIPTRRYPVSAKGNLDVSRETQQG